jgi:hypothetical protein
MTSNKTRIWRRRAVLLAGVAAAAALVIACGSGGGGGTPNNSNSAPGTQAQQLAACTAKLPPLSVPTSGNSVPIIIDNGPCVYGVPSGSATGTAASAYVLGSANVPFTSVRICVPGTTTCQTIDHILVDTGSTGLRIMSSVLDSALSLPAVTAAGGSGSYLECVQFADGYSWGSVRKADVHLAGEQALNIPVEVIGDSSAYTVPSACSGSATSPFNDPQSFGANGVLGVGLFAQDCGSGCVGFAGNGFYYLCPTTSSCAGYGPQVTEQVANPVIQFVDFQGVIMQLPALASGTVAQATLYGTLVFGINSQSNNQTALTNPNVYYATNYYQGSGCGYSAGNFNSALVSTTGAYNLDTASYCNSFIDSGSNGFFLPNDGTPTPIPTDTTANGSWFLPTNPSTTIMITATQQGIGPSTGTPSGNVNTLTFPIINAETVLFPSDNGADSVFAGLGAPSGSTIGGIDWGLPFFFGRTVYVGVEGATTTIGSTSVTGPYWAF